MTEGHKFALSTNSASKASTNPTSPALKPRRMPRTMYQRQRRGRLTSRPRSESNHDVKIAVIGCWSIAAAARQSSSAWRRGAARQQEQSQGALFTLSLLRWRCLRSSRCFKRSVAFGRTTHPPNGRTWGGWMQTLLCAARNQRRESAVYQPASTSQTLGGLGHRQWTMEKKKTSKSDACLPSSWWAIPWWTRIRVDCFVRFVHAPGDFTSTWGGSALDVEPSFFSFFSFFFLFFVFATLSACSSSLSSCLSLPTQSRHPPRPPHST